MCFSLPAVRALVEHTGEVTILCPEIQQRFWKAAGFDSIISYPEKTSARALARQLDGIERVLLWEAGIAADACARAGAAEIIGLPAPKLVKFLTKPLERKIKPGPAEHQVQRMLDTAELMGAQPLQGKFFQPIKLVTDRQPDALLITPDSDYGANHEWSPENWERVIKWLQEMGWATHLGELRDGGLASGLADKTGSELKTIDLADPLSYAGYRLCLSADSSLPHLAGAFGAVCGVLFGPGDPVLTRPLSQRHMIIRRKVECSPCFLGKCPIDLRCQNDLSVERVIEKLTSFNPA